MYGLDAHRQKLIANFEEKVAANRKAARWVIPLNLAFFLGAVAVVAIATRWAFTGEWPF